MSQDRIIRLLSDLNVLASLRPGLTLSTSTMSVIDHNSWSSSLWRTYNNENRKDTIGFIKTILTEAISILQLNFSNDLLIAIELALNGFSHLKETYKGDYYTIAEINTIINTIRYQITQISQSYSGNSSITTDPTFEQCLEELVRSELFKNLDLTPKKSDQDSISELEVLKNMTSCTGKEDPNSDTSTCLNQDTILDLNHLIQQELQNFKCSDSIIEKDVTIDNPNILRNNPEDSIQKIQTSTNHAISNQNDYNASNIQEMVSSSNRTSNTKTDENTIYGDASSDDPENNFYMSNGDSLHLISELTLTESLESSQNNASITHLEDNKSLISGENYNKDSDDKSLESLENNEFSPTEELKFTESLENNEGLEDDRSLISTESLENNEFLTTEELKFTESLENNEGLEDDRSLISTESLENNEFLTTEELKFTESLTEFEGSDLNEGSELLLPIIIEDMKRGVIVKEVSDDNKDQDSFPTDIVNRAVDDTTRIVIEASNRTCLLSKNQDSDFESNNSRESESDEIIKKINGGNSPDNIQSICSNHSPIRSFQEQSISGSSIVISSPLKSNRGIIMDENFEYKSMEFDVESEEWKSRISMGISRKYEYSTSECFEKSIREERKSSDGTSIEPADFDISGDIEEIDSTPPIIRLAKIFKYWIDSIKRDDELLEN